MKILMLSTDSQIFQEKSAVRQRILEYGKLAEELHVVIYTKKSQGFREFQQGNVRVYPTNCLVKPLYLFDAYRISKKILGQTGDWLITTQDPFETAEVGSKLKSNFDVPLQIQIHTDFLSPYFVRTSIKNRLRSWFGFQLLKKADGIRVVSDRIKHSLINRNIPEEKISVLPIFVDWLEIKNKLELAKSPWSSNRQIILTVARLAPEKNLSLAIDAINEVVKKHPHIRYVIVGGGSEHAWLKAQIERLELSKNVELIGASNPNELFNYYKGAKDSDGIFLLTSDYEGYGMAPVEAAAAGLPVVMTDVGVAIGSVVPIGDKSSIIRVLNELLNDKNKRSQIVAEQNKVFQVWPTKADYLSKMKELWQRCFS